MIKGSAYAKLNLNLKILGVKDGMHRLETEVVSLDLADELEIEEASESAVTVVRGEVTPPNACTNAQKAAQGMARLCGVSGFRVRIVKNIPDRAGLGGSSAEAAGIIRLTAQAYGISLTSQPVLDLARRIGNDVPLMLSPGTYRVRDGEICPIETPFCHFVLASIGKVSTSDAFRLFDERTSPDVQEEYLTGETPLCGNDLLMSACALNPSIEKVLSDLSRTGAETVGMSGSGACCFAAFPTRQRAEQSAKTVCAEYVKVCSAIV